MRSGIIGVVIFVLLLPFPVSAQSTFEVASVKPNTTGNTGWSIDYTADSLQATNATLSSLIQSAYGIMRAERLVGGPSWVRTTRFDVSAKAARPLPSEQLREMAQHLLESRFGVALTREQRQEEVYTLRIARADGRTGPDLRRAANDCLGNVGRSPTDRSTRTTPQSSTGAAPKYWGWCATISGMAMDLSRQLGADVIDQTGLDGRWDFVLAFAAFSTNASPTDLPSIFVAIEEQLGLKLERNARGSVEYVRIAAAHQPTEN